VDPVTITTTIARPREQVFEYLADIANHPEFTDHFLVDWRLTREDSYGHGAGARFRVKQRFNRFAFGDATLIDVEPPRLLVTAGRGGRFNRVRTLTTWTLEPGAAGTTRVEFAVESEPATFADRVLEVLFRARAFTRRRHGRALKRLRAILEEGEQRGARATVSGGARKPATGFRL
jgi:uncharacterized protein YndB with AHSA1/START domain